MPCPWTSKILHFNCIIHLSQCFGAFFGCRFSVKSALLDLMRQIAVAKEDAWPKSCIDAKVLCLLHRKVIKLPFFNSYKQALQFWLEEKSKSVWKPHHHTKSLYFDKDCTTKFAAGLKSGHLKKKHLIMIWSSSYWTITNYSLVDHFAKVL